MLGYDLKVRASGRHFTKPGGRIGLEKGNRTWFMIYDQWSYMGLQLAPYGSHAATLLSLLPIIKRPFLVGKRQPTLILASLSMIFSEMVPRSSPP